MKEIMYDLDNLTDSRELLESKTHPVIPFFLYSFIVIILTALTWSYFGEIDDYVKTVGIVRPNDKISTVRNLVDGTVEEVNFEEGKKVKKGDILYSIEYKNMDIEKNNKEMELKKLKKDLENTKKFRLSIIDNTNYFSQNDESEKEYYLKFNQYSLTQSTTNQQVNELNRKVNELIITVSNYEKLYNSIIKNKNLFNSENSENETEYYHRYLEYESNLKTLKLSLEKAKDDFDKVNEQYSNLMISVDTYDNAKQAVINAELSVQKFVNEYKAGVLSNIDQNRDKLRQYQYEYSKINDNESQKYTVDNLVKLNEEITLLENNITEIEKNLKLTKNSLENYIIKAPITGTVNVASIINKGDTISAGTEILTILPENNERFIVKLNASNKDIASIHEGMLIKYHFDALPYKEYGELTGKILKIGTDAKSMPTSNMYQNTNASPNIGSTYYYVESSIENKPLYSYKGKKTEIKVGMTCEAYVVTRSKKILYYVLEKLDLRE